ncbi:hypothetical protein FHX49_000561 [Microbacterium endophyticum]|uniref:DUF2332 domain-containing protein n=1 Tax=Microbacterium endophyticum TaxID=1526412 RepID=A0A7W4V2B6_9MICO|nr:DUF2332 domain-containing protein [Microbacterium endophyticum]MBB2975020.1 hypothetical protein [Microbacterium endophyticum]NIK37440.1 hypothetical protein [Microbacterium endophyticum]
MTASERAVVSARYARFARDEAPGRSALYADWAQGVADDPHVWAILAKIPATHRQPPLVFAATRLLGAPLSAYKEWSQWLHAHADLVIAECERRSLQTNEPLRCAALLPALALIEGPIALIELGASAGLCLYPDQYSYRFSRTGAGVIELDPARGRSSVVLDCELSGEPRVALPHVVWRAGIDLSPLDARNPEDREWLKMLVWPGEQGRAERIAAALDIAAADPPILVAGDAEAELPALIARAPEDATLVVTTPGVLIHIPRARRDAVISAASAAARWVTIDPPAAHDAWTVPPGEGWPASRFVLGIDGEIVAAVDPLGAVVEWHPLSVTGAR